MNSSHVPALTGIRAIAARGVFFGHVLHQHCTGALSILHYGWIGVNVFFALSGYLFYHLYVDSLDNNTFSWKNYASKRFARIYPLTTLAVLVSVVAMSFSFEALDVLSHITLLHGFFPQYRFSINPPLWTLTVEICFYALAPLAIVTIASIFRGRAAHIAQQPTRWSNTQLAITALVVWVLMVGSCKGLSLVYQNWVFYFTGVWDNLADRVTIVGRLADFVAGIVVAAYARSAGKSKLGGDAFVLVGATIITLSILFTEANGGEIQVGQHKLADLVFPSIAMGASFLIMGLHKGGIVAKLLASKTMVLLGDISFGLYVLHYLSVPGAAKSAVALQEYLESIGIHYVAASLINYAAFSVLAWLSLVFYEQPLRRVRKFTHVAS